MYQHMTILEDAKGSLLFHQGCVYFMKDLIPVLPKQHTVRVILSYHKNALRLLELAQFPNSLSQNYVTTILVRYTHDHHGSGLLYARHRPIIHVTVYNAQSSDQRATSNSVNIFT